MIVIIEGPRGCGKTTVATKVTQTLVDMGFNAEYVKIHVRGEDPTKDQFMCIVDWSRQADKIFVVDRFHLTELVYRMYDGKVEINRIKREMTLVANVLAELGSLVFFLYVPGPVRDRRVAARNDGRGQDIVSADADELWQFAEDQFFFTAKVSNYDENVGNAVRKIVMMVAHSFENQQVENAKEKL